MRYALVLFLLLSACGVRSERADGVTPGEAAALNAAADKLDREAAPTR